jgi:hypothetical protein
MRRERRGRWGIPEIRIPESGFEDQSIQEISGIHESGMARSWIAEEDVVMTVRAWWVSVVAVGLVVLGGSDGLAQGPSRSAPLNRNPYLNPVLNPALVGSPTDPAVPLLYLMSVNDAAGGIGSGRLSGVRPAPREGDGGKLQSSMTRTMATPGAGASRYFQRGPSRTTGRPTGFQRQNRYFGQNGR